VSSTLDDDALLAGFESCTLPAAAFRHRDHVRVAWLHLRSAPFEEASFRFCTGLRRFARAHGHAGLYHETMTWAYLALVNERMTLPPEPGGPADFDAFAAANPDLLVHEGGALARLYDPDVLASELAKRAFLLPRPSRSADEKQAPKKNTWTE
jgi:hypothetical protein